MKWHWGLRSKVLVLSSLLLLLPWFAYQFIAEMEQFLRRAQEQTLIGTTSAIATALHERPTLFNEHASFLPDVKVGQDLYVYDLKNPIRLDGNNTDWAAIRDFKNSYPMPSEARSDNSVHFNQLLGKYGDYLYVDIDVVDPSPIKRSPNNKQLTQNDHLIFAMTDNKGQLQRYIISVTEDGWFNAYRYPKNTINSQHVTRIKSIQGVWKTTQQGYNIEFRIPLSLLGEQLGFQLNTVSDLQTKAITHQISTSNLLDVTKLGSVLVPSPEIEKILLAMSHTHSRLWVVDRHQRVIARVGDIHQAIGRWPIDVSDEKPGGIWSQIETSILSPIYDRILETPDISFVDEAKQSTQLNYQLVDKVLAGNPLTEWRLTADKKASILSAAYPIFISDKEGQKVMGVVMAEETNHGLLSLRNQALQKMFNILLGIILISGLLLFLFLSSTVKRIRTLRDQSEHIIDQNGRLQGKITASKSHDEIGDLSRSMENMVQRLAQYHHYIEQLSARLSHELRTPVAVVRSSLDNLATLPNNDMQAKYIHRSQQGIQRLSKILNSMSDASRIEQSLQQAHQQTVNLNELVTGCLQGYEMIYPSNLWIKQIQNKSLLIQGDPDFLVQMLDKIIHNAIQFSSETDPIAVSLVASHDHNTATLSIENQGLLLPLNHAQDLFQSMVSIRPDSQQHDTHLGLGLYIAKMIAEYHQAELVIANNRDLTGVIVTITFQLI